MVRDIQLTEDQIKSNLNWMVHHDEDTEIYINGHLAVKFRGYSVQYELRPLTKEAQTSLKAGSNRIAIHCHQTSGGQYIDVGLATVDKQK